jgi:hypothetical protein
MPRENAEYEVGDNKLKQEGLGIVERRHGA